jgi:ABC-2 type transport system permease protein
MSAVTTIFRREFFATCVAPASHVTAAVFIVLQGLAFVMALRPFAEAAQEVTLVEMFFRGPMFWIPFLSLFPVLTMRLFAEEQKLGTMEMLLTAPVRVGEVVMAKYLAVLVFFTLLWVPNLVAFQLLRWLGGGALAPDWAALAPAYAVVLAMGAMNLAVGCFASSLTVSQLGAGIMTFGILMLHYLLGYLPLRMGEMAGPVQRFFEYVHADAHLRDAAAGLWDTRPFVYFLGFAVLMLAATGFTLNIRRWKS